MRMEERMVYGPAPRRKPIRWPNGARLAVWVVQNVEYWYPNAPGPVVQPLTADLKPDVLNTAWREYGARAGFWRLLKMMDRLGIRNSVTLNSAVCEHYPEMVQAGVERGWEYLGHGISNSFLHAGMAEDEERHQIQQVRETIRQFTGKAPAGWLGPALTETDVTADLLAEEGFRYVADFCADDVPFPLKVRGDGSILSMPYSIEINDYTAFINLYANGAQFGQMIRDQFDVLYDEGAEGGQVMCIALHPFLVGQPFRSRHLEQALKYMQGHEGVWWATGGEIADWYLSHM